MIDEFKFMPAKIEVDAGAKIVWDNKDTASHTATASDDKFDTDVVRKGDKSKALSFDTPGTYAYICDLHPFMKGTVVVR